MKERKRNTQSWRGNQNGLWLLIIAAVVLEATACVQYFYSREGIKKEATNRAVSELRRAELEIDVVTAQVEMSVMTMAILAERNLSHPDSMISITRLMVERTPHMVGAAIAFVPDYYKEKGHWFEAYSSEDKTGDKSVIISAQIGSADHDYTQSEWFENGMTIDSCWWCEPYYDNAGAKQMLVSCSYPIRDREGRVVAVALGDIALLHLKRVSEYLRIYPESFCSITSGKGKDLVTAPDTIPGRKYSIFNEFIEATGWNMAIIIPDDVIYRDLKRIGLIVTIMMFLGLALLIVIVVHSARNILNLLETSAQNARMGGELRIASKIQSSMLTNIFPPYAGCEMLDMYGMVRPAKEIGGDLYDFFVHDGHLYFCIGDVSGKGVPAALVMAVTRSLFRSMSSHEKRPAEVVKMMNDAMSEMNEQNMFVTLFLGILDLKTGKLNYCNAGHNAPLHIVKGEEDVKALPVEANLPLGILAGFTFTGEETQLRRGDSLFLYTDGLSEAENEKKCLYGEDRLLKVLGETKATTAHALTERVLMSVEDFSGEAEQSDDLTMLVVHYLEETEMEKTPEDATDDKIEHYSLVMRNDIQQIPTLAEWVEQIGLPEALNMTINLALEEAVSNVMLYAYPQEEHGRVLIDATKTRRKITFVISDSGVPFDPTKQKEADITLSAEERQIGGLGIHLLRQIMDEISYERRDGKNYLTLKKNLKINN